MSTRLRNLRVSRSFHIPPVRPLESDTGLKLLFDRRLRLEFRGAKITTDAGLLAVREPDEMVRLTEMVGDLIVDKRTGKDIQHRLTGLLRQSVYARLAGYEDTNDEAYRKFRIE